MICSGCQKSNAWRTLQRLVFVTVLCGPRTGIKNKEKKNTLKKYKIFVDVFPASHSLCFRKSLEELDMDKVTAAMVLTSLSTSPLVRSPPVRPNGKPLEPGAAGRGARALYQGLVSRTCGHGGEQMVSGCLLVHWGSY